MSTELAKAIALAGANGAGGQVIPNIGTPVAVADATTKAYVDAAVAAAAEKGSETIRFVANGTPLAGTDVDGAWIAPWDGDFEVVSLTQRADGVAGTTAVDVNLNGVSIFGANPKPSILFGGGANAVSTKTVFGTASFVAGDRVQMDIDTAQTGTARDVSVIVAVLRTS